MIHVIFKNVYVITYKKAADLFGRQYARTKHFNLGIASKQVKDIDRFLDKNLNEEETNRIIVFRPLDSTKTLTSRFVWLFDAADKEREPKGLTLDDCKFHGIKGLPRGVAIFMSRQSFD